MATTRIVKPLTVQQRSAEATAQLKRVVGRDDLKVLSVAVAEAAADLASTEPPFAARIREAYDELMTLMPSEKSGSRGTANPKSKLIPIGHVEAREIDPAAPPDPYYLCDLYGPHQLRLALDGYSLSKLKEASDLVEARNPGTKPVSKARKDAIIDYIVAHVAGGN